MLMRLGSLIVLRLHEMRKVFALLVLLLFMFGCTFNDGDKSNNSGRHGFGGSSALSVSFVEGSPSSEVSFNTPLKFALKVKNNGLYDLPSGSFAARVVGLDNNFNPSDLEGSNSADIMGVDESGVGSDGDVEIGSTAYSPEQMFDDRIIKSGDLSVEVCYPYETLVSASNFWLGSKTSDVKKGSISSGDNSNAPVQVRELQERSSGSTTDFSFKVKVIGKGSVVSSCFPLDKDEDEKRLDLEILDRAASCYYENGGERKDIGSSGSVILNKANEKIIHCSIPFDEERPIKSQLQMRLSYLYLDSIPVPAIRINRI